MSKDFLSAISSRRSVYAISNESPVPDEAIAELVEKAVLYTPSPFNMQSGRAVLLLGTHHAKLWSIVLETLRKIVPPENFASTEQKIGSFAAGYGTVLYFDDTAVTKSYGEQFPLYKDNFTLWAQHSNGMLQYAVWNLLELDGLGASLQHYNPLIDDAVKKEWDLPEGWQLIAEMPFGKPTADPDPKEFQDIKQRVRIFK